MRNINSHLLDRLAVEMGVIYLSDLHTVISKQKIHASIREIKPEEYPLEEWKETIEYILQRPKLHFNTLEEAYLFFCQELVKTDIRNL